MKGIFLTFPNDSISLTSKLSYAFYSMQLLTNISLLCDVRRHLHVLES